MKHGAAKVRRLYHDKILAGFAGSAADAFALFSRFEAKLEEYRGNMERSVVELAKDWRMDKYLRQLQAFLIVANAERAYLISGTGDLIQPDDGILAIGSGGPYALAAARALMKHTQLNAAGSPRKRCGSRRPSAFTRTTDHGGKPLTHGHPTSRAASTKQRTPNDSRRKKSCASSTRTSSGSTRPSAPWRSRCAIAGGGSSSRRNCATRSRRRTSS